MTPARHETEDVGPRFMLGLLALIATTLVLLLGLAYWLYPREIADQRFAKPFPDFPRPRLQTDPAHDMAEFHADEMRRLNRTTWVDRRAGIAHIAIGQAMRDVARGLPGWPAP